MNGFSLQGRSAVVTGGSRGIGRAIAMRLAEAGADVALTYRERAEAQHVVRDIESKGHRAVALQMDVTKGASVEEAARDARRALGPISILVNNAGINKPTDFDRVTDADWDDVLSANLKGPFICAQVFLPLLAESGKGSIVHMPAELGPKMQVPVIQRYAFPKPGRVVEVRGANAARAVPGIAEVIVTARPGDIIPPAGDKRPSGAMVLATGRNREEALAAAKAALAAIEIETR